MQTVVVAKAAVVHNGKILLIKRSETDERRPLEWDIPGGWVDEGEDVATAVVREIAEETGLVLPQSTTSLVYTHSAIVKDKNVNWIFFVVKSESESVVLSDEHVEFGWFTVQEALQAIDYDVQNNFIAHLAEAELL